MELKLEKTYGVLELNSKVKFVLDNCFSELFWVRGEISGFDKKSKGFTNIYFQLQEKDPNKNEVLSQISAVIWKSDRVKIWKKLYESKIDPNFCDGKEMRLLCQMNTYPPYGKYSLIIKDIDSNFVLGKLAQSRERIIQTLKLNGILDENKKRVLVKVPLKLGLITRVNSEAYHDFLGKLKESSFSFSVQTYDSSMQGKNVETEVCRALAFFNKKNLDAVIITRGGGAKTDLSWFDNQKIAEKIALSRTPVLTGIGHKTDYSITDMAAYSFYQTPTDVAIFLIKRTTDFLKELENISDKITYNINDYLESNLQQLGVFKERLLWASEAHLIKQTKDLGEIKKDIIEYSKFLIKNTKEKIENYRLQINNLDPVNILKKGFSITRFKNQTVKSVNRLEVGQEILTIFADGKVKSKIKNLKLNKKRI